MKDILVVITGGAHDEARLVSGMETSRIFGSHVTVAVANELPSPQVYAGDPSAGAALIGGDLHAAAVSRGEELRRWTEARIAALSSPASVVPINDFRSSLGESLCKYSRLSDLFVATLPADSSNADLMSLAIDAVLVDGACPVLCLPHQARHLSEATHAVVAWNGSRESARALNASFPLLRHVKAVTVLLVDAALRRAGETYRPGDEVLTRLEHYGISAELDRVASDGFMTADAIIAEVNRLGADLLVMGAQAEGGLRQWFHSSVSRQVLADANIPLLIAN
jgi:nucleotide-binding universal stress UspA family protein